MTDIVIDCGSAAARAQFVLVASEQLDDFLAVKAIRLTAGTSLLADADLPTPIHVPAALLADGATGKRFLTAAELDQAIAQLLADGKRRLAALLEAQREDLARRFKSVQINWGSGRTFLGKQLTVGLKGSISLALEQLLLDFTERVGVNAAARALIELRAEASVAAPEAHLQGAASVVLRLRTDAKASISLDLDDINLSLPELELPGFDFGNIDLALPAFPALPPRFAGMLGKFAGDIKVTVAGPAQPPRLVVVADDDGLRAALIAHDAVPNRLKGVGDPAILAPLDVTIVKGSTEIVTITDLKVGIFAERTIFSVDGVAGAPIDLPEKRFDFSPQSIALSGATVTPAVTEISSGGGKSPAISAVLKFSRLTISLIDDPATALSFQGEIELTSSGVHVRQLAIVQPYPLALIKPVANALMRGAHKLIDLFADVELNGGDLDGARELLRILGRLAAAVGRAAVSVSQALGKVLATAAEALESVLVRAAEMIGNLLAELAELMKSASAADMPRLQIELRIATDPLALRQILVSLRQPANPPPDTTLTALGLILSLSGSWHPAVLIDLSGDPSAYLLARRDANSSKTLATLATDLWLKTGDEPVEAIRDADKEGARADSRLISLAVETDVTAVMLIGLEGGQSRFLKKVTDGGKNPIGMGPDVHVLEGGLAFDDLKPPADIDIDVSIDKDRILPLLGMGEPGEEAPEPGGGGGTFLGKLKDSLGQVVTVKDSSAKLRPGEPVVEITLVVEIQAAGLKSAVDLTLDFDLRTFEATLRGGTEIDVSGKRIDEKALGLRWIVEPKPTEPPIDPNDPHPLFKLSFAKGEQRLELHEKARMELRLDDLSSDGSGIVFGVESFSIGRGGLNLNAKIAKQTVKLAGLDAPFEFKEGGLKIAASRLTQAVITGKGRLPEALVGEADCTVTLMLAQEADGIVLQSGKVEIDKIGQPIVCHATRFTLTLTDLGIGFVRESGGYHFYFLITGSLRFTPKGDEFSNGLLKNLSDIEIALDQVPLTGDASVLARHISFQKAIKPPKTFNVFNLFKMQIKSVGYHCASPKFGGSPAICIGGQIDLVEIGDIMKPKIDFHGLWIAPPAKGESLPRIKADGLGVDLQLSGAVKVRGTVLAVDPDTRTVEGKEIAPTGYSAYGFLGEGELEIPGWGTLEASLGFLEIENNLTKKRKKAFFFYLQKNKLAVEIPTPIWTFWLREAGFGFGYRYTLAGIKDAEATQSVAQLIKTLDEASRTQGDLARFSAWKPDIVKDNFTLALRGAFQPYPASKTWNQKREQTVTMPFFFDIVAALRSDMTLLMSARGWLGVNYNTFINNKDDFRSRPGFRGYLYISAPRKELLMRGIADSKGFIGEDWPEVRTGSALRKAVQSVDWSTLLYIRPGLLHYEVGWPDQLSVRLVDSENMKVTVRGGMIFRAAEDGLLFGYNVEAHAWLRFRGSAGRSIGASIEAELEARLVARVIAFLAWEFKGSLVYGLASLDAKLVFAVSAWMEVDLGFKEFTIRIGFRFSVQFSAAVELVVTDRSVGARVAARVGIQAFGCTLSVGVGFSFNDGELAQARSRVARFLAMSLTNEETQTLPQAATQKGDAILDQSAATAPKPAAPAPAPAPTPSLTLTLAKPDIDRTKGGNDILKTDFWLVMRNQPGGLAAALLVPQESGDLTKAGSFYATPGVDQAVRDETEEVYTLSGIPADAKVEIWVPGKTAVDQGKGHFAPLTDGFKVHCRWNAPIPGAPSQFTLGHFFDECLRSHTYWEGEPPQRKTKRYREAALPRVHGKPDELNAGLSPRDREIERDRLQRRHAYGASENTDDERVYAARSTLMLLFLDQWSTIDLAGLESRQDVTAHVSDLGLLFRGEPAELEKLSKMEVTKKDDVKQTPGNVAVLNRRGAWFDSADPVLEARDPAVTSEGIKLNWQLALALAEGTDEPAHDNPEQLLQYYRIVRTIEGTALEPATLIVKGAALLGMAEAKGSKVELLAPDWQFVDGFEESSGVPAAIRHALLPGTGPEALLTSATLWAQAFPGRDRVTVTYTVTPVDIAGVDALAKSFVVDLQQPAMPVRAAKGEIRIVQEAVKSGDDPDPALDKDLLIYLALNDKAWDDSKQPNGFVIERAYRLFVETEEVEPEGSYGTDGATARVRGPVFGAPSADARRIEIARTSFSLGKGNDSAAIQSVEPDLEEREKLPLWAKLSRDKFQEAATSVFATPADSDEFLAKLYDAGTGNRVAARFSLQTLVRVKAAGSTAKPVEHVSEIVALPIEHVIIGPSGIDKRVAVMRPDAFEVAVPMAMPPVGEHQVRARSGLAQYFVPDAGGSLALLLGGTVASVPDPQRQVATQIEFDAEPSWSGDKQRGVHASAIAGFDVYELDLDDLAPSDDPRDLAWHARTWTAAKRIAHVSEVGSDTAALLPDGNRDWKAWRSHFPSDMARAARPSANGGMLPWYSSHESVAMPPQRFPRIRLLPLPPNQTVSDLLQSGAPSRVLAKFSLAPDSPIRNTLTAYLGGTPSEAEMLAALPAVTLLEPGFKILAGEAADLGSAMPLSTFDPADMTDSPSIQAGLGPFAGYQRKAEKDGSVPSFTASALRDFLLSLSWLSATLNGKAGASGKELLTHWREDPQAFEGLSLMLVGEAGSAQTGTSEIPLDLASPVHPLLEEVLAELELLRSSEQHTYRGLTVMQQPALVSPAKDMPGLMAFTPVETDPYGWGALHTLGLARTVRIHNPAEDAFLTGKELISRINAVFAQCFERWTKTYGKDAAGKDLKGVDLGQPFVDVCLKANRDVWLSTFDKPQRVEDAAPGGRFSLNDDSLAFAQIALRPRPVAEWIYRRCEIQLPDQLKNATGKITIEMTLAEPCDVERLSDRQGRTLNKEAPKCAFAADKWPQVFISRTPAGDDAEPGNPAIVVKSGDTAISIPPEDWKDVGSPIEAGDNNPAAAAKTPYERFDDPTPEQWQEVWTRDRERRNPAARALAAWQASIKASAPDIAFPADDRLAVFAAGFIPWTKRFLDFGRAARIGLEGSLAYSLSALIDDKPLRLAADSDGWIRFKLVRPDRWGSVRAYTAKPIGRYHGILAGIGVASEMNARSLVFEGESGWVFTNKVFLPQVAAVGYGVAVSHRTEKVEKPLVLGTRMVEDAEGVWAQVVVARHSEEALASSNRTMLARLGVPSSLTSFGRVYRHPNWPKRLEATIGSSPVTYPERAAKAPSLPPAATMQGYVLGEEVQRLPAITNGADMWRIAPQPPHYRLVMTSAERAGGVVSEPVVTIHDEMPRRSLAGRGDEIFEGGQQPMSKLVRDGGRVVLRVSQGLVAYRDVTPERSLDWITGGAADVAHWPDADILYGISRRRGSATKFTEISDEAEIRLVAELDPAADESAAAIPVVVRTRGTQFEEGKFTGMERTAAGAVSHFRLTADLPLKRREEEPGKPRGEAMLLTGTQFDWGKVEAFNVMAAAFGAIETIHHVEADFDPAGAADGTAYLVMLRTRAAAARTIHALAWANRLDAWITGVDPSKTPDQLRSIVADAVRPAFEAWLAPPAAPGAGLTAVRREGAVYFRGWGGMSDEEAQDAAWQDVFEAPDARRIRAWLGRQLIGSYDGLWLRAIDARSSLPLADASIVEREIALPDWVKEATAS